MLAACFAVRFTGEAQPLLSAVLLLPGTLVLGAAAWSYWKLPKEKKKPPKVSFFHGLSHVYFFFLAAVALEVGFCFALTQGRSRALHIVFYALAILSGLGICANRIYGRWYYWTDQEHKKQRREYHRRRHGNRKKR